MKIRYRGAFLALAVAVAGCADGTSRADSGNTASEDQPTAREMVQATQTSASELPVVTVYKSPTCGCCSDWVEHMREAGFEVEAHDVNDLADVKARLGVFPQHQSCHTATVGDYVVEGHVPADLVQRLLEESPDVAGLAVPGMPRGSPGMEMPDGTKDDYDVIAFTTDGESSVFASR
ncbi:MAG: DUF411 domain-containing protein [Gemmatimonadota bacterium]